MGQGTHFKVSRGISPHNGHVSSVTRTDLEATPKRLPSQVNLEAEVL